MGLSDSPDLHLASLRCVETTIALERRGHPVLALPTCWRPSGGTPPPGLALDRGAWIELVLETRPRTLPVARLAAGEPMGA